MADGLLAQGLNFIDQQKQALAARLGLLANNPQEFAKVLAGEAQQRAGVGLLGEPKTAQEMASGAWINTPYGQQAMQAGSGFAGITAYHGTNKPLQYLDPKKSFGNLNVSWVSPDANFAARYASREGGNIMPLEVNEGKIFDFADNKAIEKLTKKAKTIEIYDPIRGSITLDKLVPNAGESYKSAENPQLFNLIKKMGYDSVAVYEDGIRNLGIFNPKKNIKSKFSE